MTKTAMESPEKSPFRTFLQVASVVVLACVGLFILLTFVVRQLEDRTDPVEIRWHGMDSGYSQITAASLPAQTEGSSNMQKGHTLLTLVVAVMILSLGAAAVYAAYHFGRRSAPLPAAPTVEIEKLARLATVKVTVADVLQASTGGSLMGVQGAWLVKGDALLTVDMSRARTVSKDAEKRRIVLMLPKPTVFQPRVDHERTRTFDVQKGLFVLGTRAESQMRDEAMRQAQQLVEQAAGAPDALQVARDVTAQVVGAIYKAVDWDVTIQWEDEQPAGAGKAGPTTP